MEFLRKQAGEKLWILFIVITGLTSITDWLIDLNTLKDIINKIVNCVTEQTHLYWFIYKLYFCYISSVIECKMRLESYYQTNYIIGN